MSYTLFVKSLGTPTTSLKHLASGVIKAIGDGNTNPIASYLNACVAKGRSTERQAIQLIVEQTWQGSSFVLIDPKKKDLGYKLLTKGKAVSNSSSATLERLVKAKAGLNQITAIKKEYGVKAVAVEIDKQVAAKAELIAKFVLANESVSLAVMIGHIESQFKALEAAKLAK